MQFIDLKAQQDRIRPQIEANIQKVLDHGKYIMGPEVFELEERLAEYVGTSHCITVSSGTDALLVAMMALGIGYGDEVITTPFTFISTGEMIALLGAKPVFVDIEADSYNIDPIKIEAAITPRTKALMPVSLYGQCADFSAINAIAQKHGIPVIEDGAQSFGATYRGGRSCGLSTIGCTSFFPSKPIGGYGDGGACFTDDDELAKQMREVRNHGQDRRYHHPRIGLNGRLDTIQAAVLLAKMEVFPEEVLLRQQVGESYSELIMGQCHGMKPPYIAEGNTSVYAQYTIQVDDREQVIAQLNEQGIPTAVHYPVPLNQQPAFAGANQQSSFPVAELAAMRVMSLPMHPYLSADSQRRVIEALCQAG
jgi:UDP-2-acetamido-2-deoxy-ribo-hexuluronate aminotransferase